MSPMSGMTGPLYEKVKTFVTSRISSGEWTANDRLPSENELVAMLGISRMTVNRALRELTTAGHLLRIQGVGTFVAPRKPLSTLIEINNIATEIAARGGTHRADVVRLETLDEPPAYLVESFEFNAPQPLGHSLVLHYENDRPVQIEERFVNAALVPDYVNQDFATMTTFSFLQAAVALTEVEHIISAIAADADICRHLRLHPGEPCLRLHRRTWNGAAVVTVNSFTYAGRHHSLGSRYKPGLVETGAVK